MARKTVSNIDAHGMAANVYMIARLMDIDSPRHVSINMVDPVIEAATNLATLERGRRDLWESAPITWEEACQRIAERMDAIQGGDRAVKVPTVSELKAWLKVKS